MTCVANKAIDMKNHYIESLHELDEGDKGTLPDRTDLSKLYPEKVSANTSEDRADNHIQNKEDTNKKAQMLFLAVGVIVPLPFIGAAFLFDFFTKNIRASTAFFFLPIIILMMLLWITTVIWVARKISNRIDKLGVSSVLILSLHMGCLMLLSPPLYTIIKNAGLPSGSILYILGTVCVSTILAWIFLQIIFNKSLSDKTRIIALVIVVTGSFLASTIYLFNNLK
jgi:hypothetical protein